MKQIVEVLKVNLLSGAVIGYSLVGLYTSYISDSKVVISAEEANACL